MRRAAFSSDGTKIAYSRGRRVANVWRVPILTGRLATWADAEQVSFDEAWIESLSASLEGRQLIVSSDRSGNKDLWLLPLDGGEMQPLTSDPAPDIAPERSPDGKWIAFTLYRSGNRDIWVLPTAGGPARQLTFYEGVDLFPAWSPDGRELAFTSVRSGNDDIWVVPFEGGAPRQVTSDPAFERRPRWSPDGKSLVITSRLQHGAEASRLWRVPLDGGSAVPLTEGSGWLAVFADGGSRIFFVGVARENIWSLSIDGGKEYPVTDFSGRRGDLGVEALATDGSFLYFTWEQDTGDIWVMDVVTDDP